MIKIAKIWLEDIQGYDPWKNSDEYYFDQKVANAVIKKIQELKQHKGEFAGKPLILERWQKKVIGHLFGWKHKKTGLRRYRKAFIFVPRKNGKTTLTAAFGVVVLAYDGEPGAEIYSAAAETDQANIVFKEASSMIEQHPVLSAEISIFRGYKVMNLDSMKSIWKVLSSDANTKHGLNPHCYIVDEVHAQKNRELMEVLETGVGSRRQPLGIYLTTADVSGDSPCNELYDYAKRVRDNEINDSTFLPVIYEATLEDDWTSEEIWKKANPNYGVSLKADYIREQCKKAQETPSFENTFKRLHLNIQTEQERRWLKMDDWDKSGQKLDQSELIGKPCYGAIDLGSVSDICALLLYFDEFNAVLCWFWVPEATAKKKIEYEVWARDGYINIAEGRVVDYQIIREKIKKLKEQYQIKEIAYDPWNASQIALELSEKDGFAMVEFRQGFVSMNEPSKETEKMIINHELNHFGNPVLRWMASNAQVKEDPAGNIKPIKQNKDSPKKIDGIVCLVMGKGLAMSGKAKSEQNSFMNSKNFDNLLKEIYG